MSLWSRAINLFRGERVSREIEEELATHLKEAIAEGRNPWEARKALGPSLQIREESRDLRLIPWLDALRSDIVFGCRQLVKRRVTSTASITKRRVRPRFSCLNGFERNLLGPDQKMCQKRATRIPFVHIWPIWHFREVSKLRVFGV